MFSQKSENMADEKSVKRGTKDRKRTMITIYSRMGRGEGLCLIRERKLAVRTSSQLFLPEELFQFKKDKTVFDQRFDRNP